ncbi:hypothetical protein [Photobacterium damselae]|uniref:hypothetical protein n=1 Tax=Photobacterium damselae TaxID=38293 RepID=UPI001F352C31|nr:hypothetical protein [Photobacterium damselae]UKA12910.1 hypothetical protein IHC91_21570 [Photobacterium damselae subsp. damselae]
MEIVKLLKFLTVHKASDYKKAWIYAYKDLGKAQGGTWRNFEVKIEIKRRGRTPFYYNCKVGVRLSDLCVSRGAISRLVGLVNTRKARHKVFVSEVSKVLQVLARDLGDGCCDDVPRGGYESVDLLEVFNGQVDRNPLALMERADVVAAAQKLNRTDEIIMRVMRDSWGSSLTARHVFDRLKNYDEAKTLSNSRTSVYRSLDKLSLKGMIEKRAGSRTSANKYCLGV